MQVEFIKNYASRMAEIFAIRAANARKRGKKEAYVKDLEGRANLWGKIAHLPADSEKWEDVSDYITLMSTPQTTKMELRRQYKFLEQVITLNADPIFQRNFNVTSTQLQRNLDAASTLRRRHSVEVKGLKFNPKPSPLNPYVTRNYFVPVPFTFLGSTQEKNPST